MTQKEKENRNPCIKKEKRERGREGRNPPPKKTPKMNR
jgi:hypothetical protein